MLLQLERYITIPRRGVVPRKGAKTHFLDIFHFMSSPLLSFFFQLEIRRVFVDLTGFP